MGKCMLTAMRKKRQITELVNARMEQLRDMDNFQSDKTRGEQRQEIWEIFLREKAKVLRQPSMFRVWWVNKLVKFGQDRWSKKETKLIKWVMFRTDYGINGRKLVVPFPYCVSVAEPFQETVDRFYAEYDAAAAKRDVLVRSISR